MYRVLRRVKNYLGETIGYDILNENTGEEFKCIDISKLYNYTFTNATYINGKKPYIRGNVELPIRIETTLITLYHGSNQIIQKPTWNGGKKYNDYGQGFYTTMDKDKAEEWALLMRKERSEQNSYCNCYSLNIQDLKIINLDDYGPLAWIAEVLKYRGLGQGYFDESEKNNIDIKQFCQKYCIDTSGADIIVGYRADDSYFQIIQSFYEGYLTVEEVKNFFYKGKLGIQVFLKSKRCFNEKYLKFITAERITSKQKMNYALNNDSNARQIVKERLNQIKRERRVGLYQFLDNAMVFGRCLIQDYKYDKSRGLYYV